jgi:hypothetical protein
MCTLSVTRPADKETRISKARAELAKHLQQLEEYDDPDLWEDAELKLFDTLLDVRMMKQAAVRQAALRQAERRRLAGVKTVKTPSFPPRPRPADDEMARRDGFAVRDPEDPGTIRYWE